MTKLTEKQLTYCRNRANGMTMIDSYKNAFNPKKATKRSIYTMASRLDKKVEIQSRIDHLNNQKDKALVRSAVSLREKVLKKLEDFMDNATTSDGNKIRAAELLGKSIGLFKDVIEDNRNDGKSAEELTELLHQKLKELQSNNDSLH